MQKIQRKKIVILGGGFAGLYTVKRLDPSLYEIHLVDRNNYHAFPPLFYQIASSGIDPTGICFPLRREILKKRSGDVAFHMGSVKSIDMDAHTVTTDVETIGYDILVIAVGTTNNFFGDTSLIEKVYTLKSVDEAIRLRNEILYRCERAAVSTDHAERKRLLSFAVIGGGPAGVEIAGALGELKKWILKREYPSIATTEMSINLIEGSKSLLKALSKESSAYALKALEDLMVDVRLGRIMKECGESTITLDDGTVLDAGMVIWTAGIKAVPIQIYGTGADSLRGPGGRIITGSSCRLANHPEIFAIGDTAVFTDSRYPYGLPQMAQVAIQEAKYVAKNLNLMARQDNRAFSVPFTYRNKGTMATIGRNRAIADIGHLHLKGFFAWITWMFIHLLSLLGMRNKLNVLTSWVWAYFTHNTTMRLLLKGAKYPLRGDMYDNRR